jgi:ABC-type arginine transport system ATPase subunit
MEMRLTNGLINLKRNKMEETAVEWLVSQLNKKGFTQVVTDEEINQAKEMEKEQMGYTNEDVLRAGEMGEINHHDTKHIVSYLDEAKHYNETFKKK